MPEKTLLEDMFDDDLVNISQKRKNTDSGQQQNKFKNENQGGTGVS